MAKIERFAAKGVWDPPTYSQAVKVSGGQTIPVSYTHLTLPTNREV